MSEYRISIEPVAIHAPAQVTWGILADLPKYPEWNPFTVQVISTLNMGEPVIVAIALGHKRVMRQQFTLEVFEPPYRIAWRLPKIGHRLIFSAYREQQITPISDDHCTYSTCDSFTGWLAGAIYGMQGAWVERNFQSMATALKARAEAMFAAHLHT